MEGTARALHVVDGLPRSKIAATYSGNLSKISFWEAKKRASENGGNLISANRMVNLFKAALTLSSSDTTKLKERDNGLELTSPNFSCFFENLSRKELAAVITSASPAWVDAVLLIGEFKEESTTIETKEKTTIIELPRRLLGKRGIMLFDSGSFIDERSANLERIKIPDDSEPILTRDGVLYLDMEGNFTKSPEFSKRKTDPAIPIFVHTQAEKISRLICGITSVPSDGPGNTQSLVLRLATINEGVRMGAVLEFP